MIDWEKSAKLNNYTIYELKVYFKKYPKSSKQIVSICKNPKCNKERIISFKQYRDLCHSCAQLKRYEDPIEREKTSKANKKRYENPKEREKQRKATLKIHKDDPMVVDRISKTQLKRYKENPELCEKQRENNLKRYEDPIEREKTSKANKKRYENPKEREKISGAGLKAHNNDSTIIERMSASHQGQDYDKGEWTGFTDKSRPHLISPNQCIHLNSKFEGSVQHHLISGIILNIPEYLHKSIWHCMPNGKRKDKNMFLINEYAFSFLLGII